MGRDEAETKAFRRRDRGGTLAASLMLVLAVLAVLLLVAAAHWGWGRYTSSPRFRLTHGAPEEQVWAIKQIATAGASARDWEKMYGLLQTGEVGVRLAVVAAMERSGDDGFITELRVLSLRDPEAAVRARAVEALAGLGGERAWTTVRKCLGSARAEIRGLAAGCVARHGRREMLADLVELAESDSSVEVRSQANRAVERLMGWYGEGETGSDGVPPGSLYIEAEAGVRFAGNFEIAPGVALRSALTETGRLDPLFGGLGGYSGSGWIRCLEGGGGNDEWAAGASGSIDVGEAEYPIVVPRDGLYRLWIRTWWMDKCGNSLRVWIDHQESRVFSDDDGARSGYREWHWVRDRKPVHLKAGPHRIHLQVREDGIRVDCLALLPEAQKPPHEAVPANLDPRVLLKQGADVALSRQSEVIDSAGTLRLTVRVLRFGRPAVDGALSLSAEDGTFDCPEPLPVSLAGDERVFERDVTATFATAAPCRERVVQAVFRPSAGGPERATRLVVTKPWPWEVAGPFRQQRSPADVLADPSAGWRSFPVEKLFDRYGRMNFESVFGNGVDGHVYLRARVRTAEGGTFLWLLNSDDQSTVWLDSKEIMANRHVHDPAERFVQRARVRVSPGEHTVVVYVAQRDFADGHIYYDTQNYWLVRLRVRSDDHAPAPIEGVPWEGGG